jgi:DNA-directed RNA polymerase specialized sigma subunit
MSLNDPNNQKFVNDFISEHAPLVHKQIKVLRSKGKIPGHIQDDDLHEHGFVGLMHAMDKYDHDKAEAYKKEGDTNPFVKFAEKNIRGHILNHVASQDEVPKTIRNKIRNLTRNKGADPKE